MARKDLIEARVTKLASGFGRYVRIHDEQVPFTGEQLAAHRACIALRRQAGSVRAATSDEAYVDALRRTLLAWGIGRRASHLVDENDFTQALRTAVPRLEALEPLIIDSSDLPADTGDRLWSIVESLGVVENKAKLVAGTKTLHHLLPDLVPPMDRAWTGAFFNFHLPEWQGLDSQHRIFGLAYNQFVTVARRVHPEQYVTGQAWRTSRTKVLDNALIGFCKAELGERSSTEVAASNEISFDVQGYPPAKDGATSIFGAGHSHASRVRLLLEAARRASAEQLFSPVGEGHIALDVEVRAPANQPPWDATNYLGGIGDVLEDKAHRGLLDHLDDLTDVWLYRNDRQIKEIAYREVASDRPGYTVTVRQLGK